MNTYTGRRHPLIAALMTVRLARGLQQTDVAEAGGINRNTVGSIESGKRNPSLEMFDRYCRALGFRLEVVPLSTEPRSVINEHGVYTIREVARRLELSEATIFALVKDGKLGSVKNGRYRRFTEENVQQYLGGRKVK